MNEIDQLDKAERFAIRDLRKEFGLTAKQAKLLLCCEGSDTSYEMLAFLCMTTNQAVGRMSSALTSKGLAYVDGLHGDHSLVLTEKGWKAIRSVQHHYANKETA